MFYSQLILAKKGPLGRVWLAAHMDRKLTKHQIFLTNIKKSAEAIANPEIAFALRMSGHLLLGVVRIHSRQVKYLLADCSEALVKMKMVLRPGVVDLPPEANVASYGSITLPETLAEIELNLPEFTEGGDMEGMFDLNVAIREHITLANAENLILRKRAFIDEADPLAERVEDFPPDSPMVDTPVPSPDVVRGAATPVQPITPDMGGGYFGGPDDGPSAFDPPHFDTPMAAGPPATPGSKGKTSGAALMDLGQLPIDDGEDVGIIPPAAAGQEKRAAEPRQPKAIDDHIEISSDAMRRQLRDTSGIVRTMVTAPPNKKARLRFERDALGAEAIYHMPNTENLAPELIALFARTLVDEEVVPSVEVERERPITPPPFDVPVYDPPVDIPDPDPYVPAVSHGDSPPPASPYQGGDEYLSTPHVGFEGGDVLPQEDFSMLTRKTHVLLSKTLRGRDQITFRDLAPKTRRRAAQDFLELLVLKTKNFIDLRQEEPYEDIIITKTDRFDTFPSPI
eukprot:TRINITY_DN8830_c0_g1_i7.p1 TRINITY_DN8830_c0_g1~~TRINITY_DN8830_c0_g1_i7.p1  ORF type:complete len:510 (-),score=124.76 TRINITY_DN8830_c0_g1_i7:24-1553(-)